MFNVELVSNHHMDVLSVILIGRLISHLSSKASIL